MMNKILGSIIGSICLVYIENMVVWGVTPKECLANVKTVVCKLREHGLLCNGEKCLSRASKAYLQRNQSSRKERHPKANTKAKSKDFWQDQS